MSTVVDRHRSDFDVILSRGSFGDILGRAQAGADVVWLMNNNTPSGDALLPAVTQDWHFKAAADFDTSDNGNADILWQNDNGALALWQMQGPRVSATSALPNP